MDISKKHLVQGTETYIKPEPSIMAILCKFEKVLEVLCTMVSWFLLKQDSSGS